jgi:hypothetical protein
MHIPLAGGWREISVRRPTLRIAGVAIGGLDLNVLVIQPASLAVPLAKGRSEL